MSCAYEGKESCHMYMHSRRSFGSAAYGCVSDAGGAAACEGVMS